MVAPLVVAGLGGLALSGGANLYSQYYSRKLYRRQINAYNQMYNGYNSYLAKHGRRINPTRGYLQWGRNSDIAQTNLRNSYAGSFGTAGGTFGAGAMIGRSLSRWL